MLQLPEALTQRLVSGVHHAFNTEVNDILLAALVKSLSDLGWGNAHTIMLEGHGREDISPQHDVSRTVGWFTSTYPLLLAVPADASLQDESSVADGFDSADQGTTPCNTGQGIGFAAFGQHHPEGEQLALSPIVFNYLGLQTQAKGDWRPIGIEPARCCRRSTSRLKLSACTVASLMGRYASPGRLSDAGPKRTVDGDFCCEHRNIYRVL